MGGAMGGALSKAFAPLAAVASGVAIGGMFKSAITEASDLGESVNAVNVVFGDAAKGILNLGKNAATAVGLSNVEFNGLAVQFSNFAQTVAGPGGDVVKTMQDLTGRAADFASVMNLDVAEAATLFQSGLAGQTEPLRRFGIDMSAAAVEAYALEKGLATSKAGLTEQIKVQARYGLLMDSTSKTQGDFANTSDSLANQQRILSSRFSDAKAALGQNLLPIMERGISTLNSMFEAGSPVRDLFARISPLFKSAGDGAGVFTRALAFIKPLFEDVRAVALPILAQMKTTIKAVFEDAGPIINAFKNIFTFVFPLIWAQVKFYMNAVKDVIQGALKIIQGVVKVFSGILTGDFGKVWEGVKDIFSGALQAIWGFFRIFLLGRILGIAKSFAPMLGRFFMGAMRGAGRAVSSGLSTIFGFFRSAPSMIVRGLARLGSLLLRTAVGALRMMLRGARSGAGTVMTFMRGLPGKIGDALAALPGKMLEIGGNIIGGIARGITGGAGKVIESIKSAVTDKLPGFVKKALGIKSPSRVFMGIGANVAEGMAIGIEKGSPRVSKAMKGLTGVPALGAAGSARTGAAGGPLVGALTVQSTGNVRDDLAEVEFMLRRIHRGGTYA